MDGAENTSLPPLSGNSTQLRLKYDSYEPFEGMEDMATSSKPMTTSKRKAAKAEAGVGVDLPRKIPNRTGNPTVKKKAVSRLPASMDLFVYKKGLGIDAYLKRFHDATPMQIVEIERQGVSSAFIVDLSQRMELPPSRMFTMLRIPKATAARKTAAGAVVDGRAGQAAIGMVKLLGIAQDIVQSSTAESAKGFDALKWLGQWIERPQPALGGRKPADLLDTPTGVDMVGRLLGAIQSGAYQ